MLRISVTNELWRSARSAINGDLTREKFNEVLVNIISVFLEQYSNCQKTVITLPMGVTKVERYNIHRLSIHNELSSESFGDVPDRYMEITISKSYVEDIFRDYKFTPTPTEAVLKSEKQLLFDSLLTFIQTNLPDEFMDYIRSI